MKGPASQNGSQQYVVINCPPFVAVIVAFYLKPIVLKGFWNNTHKPQSKLKICLFPVSLFLQCVAASFQMCKDLLGLNQTKDLVVDE